MSLRFITGRAGSGKTYTCLKEISEKQKSNTYSGLFYIVPEQYTLQAERDILALTDTEAVMQAQVLSFNRLSYNIFSLCGGVSKTPLDDIGKALILKKIVFSNKERFSYFKNCCSRTGFIDQLSDIITEFFKYNISPQELMSSSESSSDAVLKSKLSDLSLIYSEFLACIKSDYISPDSNLDILYEKIEESGFINGAEIWIDGFFSFTPQELKIIERLMTLAKNVTIALTIGSAALKNNDLKMTSVFYETKNAFNQITLAAERNGIKTEIKTCENIYRFKTPSLAYLEKSLLTYSSAKYDDSQGISIYAAGDRFDEAENTACRIISLVREQGLRFGDIAVLTGDLENSVSMLKNVFTQNNIPFFADVKRPLSGFPIISLITGLFDSILMNMSYDSVFLMLKTGLLPFTNDETEILENYVLSHGIKSYKWQYQWQYADIHSAEEGFNEKVNSLRQKVLDIINIFSDKVQKNKKYSVEHISRSLFEFLDVSGSCEAFQEITSDFEEQSKFEQAYENRQCFNALCSILDTMCSIIPNEEVTLKEYRDMFEAAVESKKIGIIPPETDSVIIGDTNRSRLPEISAVFIINANEGVFPKTDTSSGVFSDTERTLLSSAGLKLAADSKEAAFLQQFAAYTALTRAGKYLFISYIKKDSSGRQLMVSPVIERIRKTFPNISVTDSSSYENRLLLLNSPYSALHSMGNELKAKNPAYIKACEFFKSSPQWSAKAETIISAFSSPLENDYLTKKTAGEYFSQTLYSSVSRLERFSSCPYMYFMTYTLKAKERPLFQINTPDLGIIFHGVIEEFSKYLQENNISWNDADNEAIEKITDISVDKEITKLSNDIFLSSYTMKYLVKRLKKISSHTVRTIVDHVKKGAFVPYAFETSFGSGGLAPIVIELGDGKRMLLTGKIDRVDILDTDGKTYVKIIDYKSGSRTFSLQDIYYGLQLQLMIYLDAIIKSGLFKDKTAIPGGVFYFKIKEPVAKPVKDFTAENIKQLIEKELKMSGLVLMDENVISAMDREFSKASDIIPVSRKTDGSFSQASYTADEKAFNAIMDYCLKSASSLGREIIKGRIGPSPYVSGTKTPCSYCQYKSVCSFDSENSHGRILKSLKNDEVIEMIKNDENSDESEE